jgi:hypothetical protein
LDDDLGEEGTATGRLRIKREVADEQEQLEEKAEEEDPEFGRKALKSALSAKTSCFSPTEARQQSGCSKHRASTYGYFFGFFLLI